MSEAQLAVATAQQFITRWSSQDLAWTKGHVQIVAMAILYGEQRGLETGAQIADDAFARLSQALGKVTA